jgi:hypothetical protein
MKPVLVDTCIWSLALRGKQSRDLNISKTLSNLIYAEKVKIIGPIRQELLSGYSDINQFTKLKDKLAYFPNEAVIDDDYLVGAEFSNLCRKKGVQGSHTDFLICAVANRLNIDVYTTDKDFKHYSDVIPVALYLES